MDFHSFLVWLGSSQILHFSFIHIVIPCLFQMHTPALPWDEGSVSGLIGQKSIVFRVERYSGTKGETPLVFSSQFRVSKCHRHTDVRLHTISADFAQSFQICLCKLKNSYNFTKISILCHIFTILMLTFVVSKQKKFKSKKSTFRMSASHEPDWLLETVTEQ